MGNFAFSVPSLGTKFIDYRNAILGDSFNWSWVHPLNEYRYIVIHHAAGPGTQTPDEIAAYHVNSRGWGGIGYHFVVTQDGRIYYVGDLTTARAHVANMNHLCIGICLIGSFIDGSEPKQIQLNSAHELCAQLLFRTPEVSGVDGWEDVVGHQTLGSTRCPGDTWVNWRPKMINAGIQTPPANTRTQEITMLYQIVLGRSPDQSGLNSYLNGNLTIEQIRKVMTESTEHKSIINKSNKLKQALNLTAEALANFNSVKGKLEEVTRL